MQNQRKPKSMSRLNRKRPQLILKLIKVAMANPRNLSSRSVTNRKKIRNEAKKSNTKAVRAQGKVNENSQYNDKHINLVQEILYILSNFQMKFRSSENVGI